MSTLRVCTCRHEFQDRRYGEHTRLHVWSPKPAPKGSWRCTVSGAEQNVGEPTLPAERVARRPRKGGVTR
jgi:hypothetical protein